MSEGPAELPLAYASGWDDSACRNYQGKLISNSKTNADLPNENPKWDKWLYRIGCPVWGCRTWADQVYPPSTSSSEYLAWYSSMFPTVEGNSTFYAVPPAETFEKWRDTSAATFRFSFKFPRRISHDLKLSHCDVELRQWLERLAILHDGGRLGPDVSPASTILFVPLHSSAGIVPAKIACRLAMGCRDSTLGLVRRGGSRVTV